MRTNTIGAPWHNRPSIRSAWPRDINGRPKAQAHWSFDESLKTRAKRGGRAAPAREVDHGAAIASAQALLDALMAGQSGGQ